MSDADDSFLSVDDSSEVAERIKHCTNMKPEVINNLTKSKSKHLSLRACLEEIKTGASKERTSRRIEDRKQVEDHSRLTFHHSIKSLTLPFQALQKS